MKAQKYAAIADDLRGRILSGDLPAGAALPSNEDLAAQHGVARGTVRRAIEDLQREGLVYGRTTAGMFVRDRQRHRLELSGNDLPGYSPSFPRLADKFLAAVSGPGRPLSQTLHVDTVIPPQGVATRLETGDQPVVLRHRVMYVDNQRVSISNAYFPQRVAAGTRLEGLTLIQEGDLAVLERAGTPAEELVDEIFVRPATAAESAEIGWVTGQSILGQLCTGYDAHTGGRPIGCWVALLPSERFIIASRRYRDVRHGVDVRAVS